MIVTFDAVMAESVAWHVGNFEFFGQAFICRNGQCQSVSEKFCDVIFVIIFELEDKFFDEIFVGKSYDESFEMMRFICFAIETGFVIWRKFVAIGADFWMRIQKFFAGLTEIIAWHAAIYAGSGEEEIDYEHECIKL